MEGVSRTYENGNSCPRIVAEVKDDEWIFDPDKCSILNSVDADLKDVPVCILGIIGPNRSGKSFLTDLLIQYYDNQGEGGWFVKLLKKEEPMRGFSCLSVSTQASSQPRGIQLWPVPFWMKMNGGTGKDVAILILHIDQLPSGDGNVTPLEQFMVLVSSRMAEIEWENCELKLLKLRERLSSLEKLPSSDILPQACDSIVYVIRSETRLVTKSETDEEVRVELKKRIKERGCNVNTAVLGEFKKLNIEWLKESLQPLHDESGRANSQAMKIIGKTLTDVVQTITDDSEVSPKTMGNGEKLTLGKLEEYFKTCFDFVCSLNSISSKDSLEIRESENVHASLQGIPDIPLPETDSDDGDFEKIDMPNEHLIHTTITQEQFTAETIDRAFSSPEQPCNDLKTCIRNTTMTEKSLHSNVEIPVIPNTSDDSPLNTSMSPFDQPGIKLSHEDDFIETFRTDLNDVLYKPNVHAPSFNRSKSATTPGGENRWISEAKENDTGELMDVDNEQGISVREKESEELEKIQNTSREKPERTYCYRKPSNFPSSDFEIKRISKQAYDADKDTVTMNAEKAVHGLYPNLAKDISEILNEQPPTALYHGSTSPARSEYKDTSFMENSEDGFRKYSPVSAQTFMPSTKQMSSPLPIENRSNFPSHMEITAAASSLPTLPYPTSTSFEKPSGSPTAQVFVKDNVDVAEEAMEVDLESQQVRQMNEWEAMNVILSTASSQLQPVMKSYLSPWIQYNLNIRNSKEIVNIYNSTVNDICKEYGRNVHSTFQRDFEEGLKKKADEVVGFFLLKVEDAVNEFKSEITTLFKCQGCFSLSQFNEIFENQMTKMKRTHSADTLQFVIPACTKLKENYIAENELILRMEKDLAQSVTVDVKDLYNKEMERYLKQKPSSPSQLDQLSQLVIHECVEVFENAFYFSGHRNAAISDEVEKLKTELKESFRYHEELNARKLKEHNVQIKKIQSFLQKQYAEKMEELLQNNPNGLQNDILLKHHVDISNNLRSLLRQQIKAKILHNEPIENHWTTLECRIEKYWKTVKEKNNNAEMKGDQRKENIVTQQVLPKRTETSLIKFNSATTLSSGNAQLPFQNSSSSNIITRRSASPFRSKVADATLPPLVFQLCGTRLVMGMMVSGNVEILKNPHGEKYTPAVVGLTYEGSLLYGADVTSKINSDGEMDAQLKGYWCVGDHFDEGGTPEDIVVDGKPYTISLKFLLGYLFDKLKRSIELKMGGLCTASLITVPSWLTTEQRFRVQEGASWASFSNTYLVSESSAVAFAFASNAYRYKPSGNFAVLSENSGYVDVSAYSYSSKENKVTMTNHCGDYNLTEKKEGKFKAFFKKFYKSKILQSEGGVIREEDLQSTRRAYKQAIGKQSKIDVVVTYECDKMRDILHFVRKEFGGKEANSSGVNENDIIIHGGVLLAQQPSDIGKHVKDNFLYVTPISGLRLEGASADTTLQNVPNTNQMNISPLPRRSNFSSGSFSDNYPAMPIQHSSSFVYLDQSQCAAKELSDAKQAMIKNCIEMLECIRQNKIGFKSDTARGITTNHINEALNLAQNSASSLDEIKTQTKFVTELRSKYNV